MKKILVALTLLLSTTMFGQEIKGRLTMNESWKPMVYLIEVKDYNLAFIGASKYVVDSAAITQDGYFEIQHLKPNTLYRFNVVPKDVDEVGYITQGGADDNYAFFITQDTVGKSFISADISKLYSTFHAVCIDKNMNKIQQQIAKIRATKFPVLDLMQQLISEQRKLNPNDTNALNDFNTKAITKIQQENLESNKKLIACLDSFDNPLVLSLGLIFDGVGQLEVKDDVARYQSKLKPSSDLPLVKSILDYGVKQEIDLSFLSKEYPLIKKGNLKMDTIQSKFVLLDFWASWCVPCRQSIKSTLKNLSQKYDRNDLTIIGIATDKEKTAALKAISADKNINLQIWEGEEKTLSNTFNISSLPTCILINQRTKELKTFTNAILAVQYIDAEKGLK